jgi:hypothetical protein
MRGLTGGSHALATRASSVRDTSAGEAHGPAARTTGGGSDVDARALAPEGQGHGWARPAGQRRGQAQPRTCTDGLDSLVSGTKRGEGRSWRGRLLVGPGCQGPRLPRPRNRVSLVGCDQRRCGEGRACADVGGWPENHDTTVKHCRRPTLANHTKQRENRDREIGRQPAILTMGEAQAR